MDKFLGVKKGMTQIFDESGNVVPVTVIETKAEEINQLEAGDLVCVSGVSIGKGFAGTVKRFHHHRGPMTHGSKSHRLPGSIGSGTTPGRVYKGRGMPGRMGAGMVTVKNLRVASVDPGKNILLVAGAVPGKSGNLLAIRKKGKIE